MFIAKRQKGVSLCRKIAPNQGGAKAIKYKCNQYCNLVGVKKSKRKNNDPGGSSSEFLKGVCHSKK